MHFINLLNLEKQICRKVSWLKLLLRSLKSFEEELEKLFENRECTPSSVRQTANKGRTSVTLRNGRPIKITNHKTRRHSTVVNVTRILQEDDNLECTSRSPGILKTDSDT